ncbi:MAG: SUMF1/EgtB/PvdO family nonheme iron enzyme [Fimbriimonadaceae bacterium]|nr:SUMF1/EgtB/PvdO family nonheme iron enzyme [Fimbriimonadaceae bacterium]
MRYLALCCLLTGAVLAEGTATLVLTARPDGALVVVDGQEAGRTPLTLVLPVPAGTARELTVEVRLPGYQPRRATVTLSVGETLVWSGILLQPIGGETVAPTGPTTPLGPGPTITVGGEAFPPAGWPAYLGGFRPPAGLRFRVARRDAMPQVLLPAGEFQMGSTTEQVEQALRLAAQTGTAEEGRLRSESPARMVRLEAYWLDLHEVTVEQYCRFLNDVKPTSEERLKWVGVVGEAGKGVPFPPLLQQRDGVYSPLDKYAQHPVPYVSFAGAEAYARWAGRRLPSEAEWERAARATTAGAFWGWPGEQPPLGAGNLCDLSHVGRFPQIKKPGRYFLGYDDGYDGTAPVAAGNPNAWGLYDLLGNLWEWCADVYAADYYATGPASNPLNSAPAGGPRVLRGGAFLNAPWAVRPGCRLFEQPTVTGVAFGFRCAQTP